MKYLLLLSILYSLLAAQNPRVYSALGDTIYDNVDSIERLNEISAYKVFEEKILQYVLDVYEANNYGKMVEKGDISVSKKKYLRMLRKLSKTNDFFLKSVLNVLKQSIEQEDTKLMTDLINSGLVDLKDFKAEIKSYLIAHLKDIKMTKNIEIYLDEDNGIKKSSENSSNITTAKVNNQEDKIRRIRDRDKEQDEALRKSLDDEAKKKKVQIRQEQIEELHSK